MTTTFGTADFLAAMKGVEISASTPAFDADVELISIPASDEFSRFAMLTDNLVRVKKTDLVSPADAARSHWKRDVMPETMRRLA